MEARGPPERTGSVPAVGRPWKAVTDRGIGGPALSLLDGEEMIWSGQPYQGWRLTPSDGPAIVQGALVTAFAVFWEICVARNGWSGVPLVFALFGAPFVCVGLYMLAGRYPVDAWLRRRTRYALTSRRIVIARSAPFGSVTVRYVESLSEVFLIDEGHGRGTIRFGRRIVETEITSFGVTRYGTTTVSPGWDWAFSSMTPSLDSVPQFIGIDNAADVFDQIQRAFYKTSRSNAYEAAR